MNIEATKTRSQQRIEQLINIGRPLSDEESDELYRALHADYMREWRAAKARNERKRMDLAGERPAQRLPAGEDALGGGKMIPLTSKQIDLLEYLRSCDRAPSFDEMRSALGLRSKSGVHRLINALEERGYIRRAPNRARAIELVDDPTLRVRPLPTHSLSELASEARRRRLVLGRIFHDINGARRFENVG